MPTKLLFYAHNGRGLGHFSRLSKIARFLQSEVGDLSILFVSQCSMAHGFELPPGADLVRIPGVLQTGLSAVSKRLPLSFEEVANLRRQLMLTTGLAYRPDLFLVDHSPTGVFGDILPLLRALRELPDRPLVVCGLLDMLGSDYLRRKWEAIGAMEALDELYDEIWVYGRQEIFDVAEQYGMPDSVARKVRYCGYIGVDPPARSPEAVRDELGVGDRKLVVVTTGGVGMDGSDLVSAFLDAIERLPAAVRIFSMLVTGPEFPADALGAIREQCERVAAERPGAREFRVLPFAPKLVEYLRAADAVVSRGGYNTLTEAVSLGVRPIVVPLSRANNEQRSRAEAFAERGLVSIPDHARPLPEALAEALAAAFEKGPPATQGVPDAAGIDFGGLPRVRDNFLRLLAGRT